MSAGRERRGVVLAVILIGYLLILIDVSILFAALPTIHRDLGFSPTSLSWAQNAYTLAFGGLLLLGARAGDLAGRRRMFTVGIGVFAAASLAVGLAQSPAWMVAARAVQGVGAAIRAPSTLALLSTSFPEGTQRTRAMAAYGAPAGLGTAFGLIVGGVLTTTLSWRIGFLLNVPVGLAAILGAPRVLPETVRHAGRLNVSDALSSTVGVSAVVFGIVHSADAGWGDPVTVGALLVGLTLVGVFVTRQHGPGEPLMPLRLFADRERAGAYAARFLFNGVLVSWFFFMTQYCRASAASPRCRQGWLPPRDRRGLRRGRRDLAADPARRRPAPDDGRLRGDAHRHRLDEPCVADHRVRRGHRAADARLRRRPGPRPEQPDHWPEGAAEVVGDVDESAGDARVPRRNPGHTGSPGGTAAFSSPIASRHRSPPPASCSSSLSWSRCSRDQSTRRRPSPRGGRGGRRGAASLAHRGADTLSDCRA